MIKIEDAIVINHKIFFFLTQYRVLFGYDMLSGEYEVESMFPQGNINDTNIGIKMFCLGNSRLLFTPMGGDRIWCYEIGTDNWTYTTLPIKTGSDPLQLQIFNSACTREKIICVGCFAPYVIVVEVREDIRCKVVSYGEWRKIGDAIFDRHTNFVINEKMIIPYYKKGKGIIVDSVTSEVVEAPIDEYTSKINDECNLTDSVIGFSHKNCYIRMGDNDVSYVESGEATTKIIVQEAIKACIRERVVNRYFTEAIMLDEKDVALQDMLDAIV